MKQIKALPLLLVGALLASCSGSGYSIPTKDFLYEGNVVSFKDGVAGYVQAVKNAKYAEWTPHNYAIRDSNIMYEVNERSCTSISAYYKSIDDSKKSTSKVYDSKNQIIKSDWFETQSCKDEGTYVDEDSEELQNGSGSSSSSSHKEEYFYVEGMYVTKVIPEMKVYTQDSMTGFNFDVYITEEYTQMLAPILVYYEDFSALPITTTEEGYKAAVEKAFNINPNSGDTITISLNKNVITFNYTTNVKVETKRTKTETVKEQKMQMVLDQNNSVFNYKYHEVKKDTIKMEGFEDCKLINTRTTDFHWSKWAEDGSSLTKPDISVYTKYIGNE